MEAPWCSLTLRDRIRNTFIKNPFFEIKLATIDKDDQIQSVAIFMIVWLIK